MGISYNPRIVTDSLVLSLDAGNSKSYDSKENLLLYSRFIFSSMNTHPTGWTGFNPGRIVRSIGQSPDGTDAAIVGKQFNNSGGFRPSTAITLSSSTTYTVSFYARKPTDSELTLFLSYFATNDATGQPYAKGVKIRYDDTDTSTGSTGSTSFTLTDSWQRFAYTFNSGSDTIINPNFTSLTIADAYDPTGLFVIASIQIERGSSASPYYATSGTSKSRGTTWTDLSGNGNNGTLVNGVGYSSDILGGLTFDGADDSITIANSSSLQNALSLNSFTITTISKSDDFTTYPKSLHPFWIETFVLNNTFAINNKGMSSGDGSNGPSSYDIEVNNGGTYFRGTVNHNSVASTIYHRSIVIDRTNGFSFTYYVNGVGVGQTGSSSITGSIYTSGGMSFGNMYGWMFNGSLYSLSLHSKALSAAEVQQNFNATRSRYGI